MSEEAVNADPYMYNGFPMNTPMDIRLGLTQEEDINHELRWGSSVHRRFRQTG